MPEKEDVEAAARPMNDLNIHLGEHWGIIGKTGSGKTYFTMKGLLSYYRLHFPHAKRYVIDSTNDPDMLDLIPDALIVSGDRHPDLLHDSRQTLVWTPNHSKLPDEYADFFDLLNDSHEPEVVVVDERKSITGVAEDAFETLLMQLRKHGGTVIVLGQKIAGLDEDLFRQLTHFVQFRLNREIYDNAQARSYLNVTKEEQKPPRYPFGFFHRITSGDYPAQEYRDMDDFFKHSI
jgi:DNA helicase HerA-like ATPase